MSFVTIAMIRHFLPKTINNQLFGHRDKYGQKAWENDPDWRRWLELYPSAYESTQRSGSLQRLVNNSGYDVLRGVDLDGMRVGEIGPGGAHHVQYFNGVPAAFHAFDVCGDFFTELPDRFGEKTASLQCSRIEAYEAALPVADNSLDIMLSFYSLEHLYPLESWTKEIFRVLKPGGKFVGAFPTEGGLLWGLGRWMTSRRTLQSDYDLDIRKIVCWEHPNMCDDIVNTLSNYGNLKKRNWPLPFFAYDLNLVVKFIAEKPRHE